MASTYQDKNTPQGTTSSQSLGSSLAGKVSTPQPSGVNTPIAKAASSNNYINQVNDAMNSGIPRFNASANDSVSSAQSYLQNVIANKPGSYQSKYTGQLNNLYDQLINRGSFNYNMNGDALYDQYKQRYTAQGQRAMRDTMGQAVTQTGGYANSYAQSAGQDAYNSYMAQLQQTIPQLQAQAQQRYNDETTRLTNQYNLVNSADQTDYGRYRDQASDYYNDLNYATNAENNAYNRAYNEWSDRMNMGMQAVESQRQQDQFNKQMEYNERDLGYKERDLGYRERELGYKEQELGYRDRDLGYKEQDLAFNNRQLEANERSSAQNLVSTMLSAGAKPSKELMQQAGYSEADVKALYKKVKKK